MCIYVYFWRYLVTKKKKRKNRGNAQEKWLIGAVALLVALLLLWSSLAPSGRVDGRNEVFSTEVTGESPIRINEVMASNLSSLMLANGTLPDWFELVNTSGSTVSLNEYSVSLGSDPTQICRFQNVTIPPKGYLVVYADGGATTATELHAPFRLSASGETLLLKDASGRVVDSAETPELGDDQVWCRDGSSWKLSLASTPGEANRIVEQNAGEGAQLKVTVVEEAVAITEVLAGNATYCPDADGEYHDYIEITNSGLEAVNLKGWHLSDTRENIACWQFPDVTVPAGGTLLVYCSGYDRKDEPAALHTNFRLSSGGTDVLLTKSNGQTVSFVEVPALEKDQAYSLVNGTWTSQHAPTPGAANTRDSAAAATEQVRMDNGFGVQINEIAASFTAVNSDWIELYNGSNVAVDLSGYGLSDNSARPRKWQFPQGTVIEPRQYLAVFCSGMDVAQNGQLHTNYKLSADGGYTVSLSTPEGQILDRVFVPQQYQDITYGRVEGRQGFWFFTLSTPLAKNDGAAYYGRAAQAQCSVDGGLFETGDSFEVTLTAEPGARIYYTLDNTDPTEQSTPYTHPITVSDTTILRTRVYADNYLESFMDTRSYLYNVNNGNGVYVVSLVSDPYNLNSEEAGIMIKGPNASDTFPYKGANYWQDWEREAHVEIFGGDGELVLDSGCGIKLHGQYSRAEKQQAFKVIARTQYGNNRFDAALFSKRDYDQYQSFVLRSSGQDTDKVRMRDSVLCALADNTSVMYQETEICVLYLDGAYWGQYNIRERISVHSICQFEGWEGDEDLLDLVKANTNTMQGSNETFANLLKWVKQADPATDEFYETLDEAIDIQNYIEYMAIQIFVGNGDTLNVKRYRNPNADGKWRWVLFDLDWAFDVDTNSINRWLEPGGMGTNLYTDNSLFIACMKNPRFRDEFLTHMGKEMATTFTTENVLARFNERLEVLEPLLPEQLERWGQTQKQYQQELKKLVNYAQTRPTKLLQYFMGIGVSDSNIALTQQEMEHYFGDAMAIIQNSAA